MSPTTSSHKLKISRRPRRVSISLGITNTSFHLANYRTQQATFSWIKQVKKTHTIGQMSMLKTDYDGILPQAKLFTGILFLNCIRQ